MAQPVRRIPPRSEGRPRAPADGAPVGREARLWVAVDLPDLALHAAGAAAGDRRPTIVAEPSGGRLRVVAANGAARSRGIEAGLDLNAAFAFSGALRVLERSLRDESAVLEALAAACGRLTPTVSLEPPKSVLLEVRASLKLFGGLAGIKKTLKAELDERGLGFRLAVAPTPLAALWLARAGSTDVLSAHALPRHFERLPLHVTGWPDEVRQLLEGIGVTRVGQCLKLPRDGFARRAGVGRLQDLDKALGRSPDLREDFQAPQTLRFEVELLDETTSLPVFVDAVTRMTERLADELRMRQAQVRQMSLSFRHLRRAPGTYRLELIEPSCERRRLLELLCDRLERITLPAPAVAVGLTAGPLEPAQLPARRLFDDVPDAAAGGAARSALVERLRGRFGAEEVHAVATAADHRPERAWTAAPIAGATASHRRHGKPGDEPEAPSHSDWAAARPLWLLPSPRLLAVVDGVPRFGGPLHVSQAAERIESGWWDGADVRRDYFVAETPDGARLWIYRDRSGGGWYLHGVFG